MGTNFNHDTGFIRVDEQQKRVLKLNDVPFARFTKKTNNLGTYVIGNKLYDNGSVIAVSSEQNPALEFDGSDTTFGGVPLVTEGKVINITLEDYNTLYNHGLVEGYKYFDPLDVYRIVANVATAPLVTYVRDHEAGTLTFSDGNNEIVYPEMPYLLYNNVVGEATDNEEDTEKSVTQINAPYLSVRYFNPRITVGDTIKVPIAVDNYFADYLNGRTINGVWKQAVTGPYTIELRIEDKNDVNSLVTKTIFAGESIIETPAFNTAGETWFTLRCIDENGCASAVHYLDVMVDDGTYQENLWEVSDNDYGTGEGKYNIHIDNTTAAGESEMVTAYRNKMELSRLFADAVSKGYNGVKLPKHTYKICDYANRSGDPNTIVLNDTTSKYWYCEVGNNGVLTSVEQRTEEQVMADYDGLETNTIPPYNSQGQKLTSIETGDAVYNKSGEPRPAGEYYFVAQGDVMAGDPLVIPSNFTLDLNESTIEVVKQYDIAYNKCILLQYCTDTHIRNGKFKGGLHTYDWKRAVVRTSADDPMEQVGLFNFVGARFGSLTDLTIEGIIGFTDDANPDIDSRVNAISGDHTFTPWRYAPSMNGSGMYDGKTLDLEDGSVGNAYTGVETFVMADTENEYGTDVSAMGYMPLRQGEDAGDYIFIGYGVNWVTRKGLRKECFVFFYDDNDELVKVVKTRTTWLVRIPAHATKVRVMGYGHSIALPNSAAEGAWTFMGVSQVRGGAGMVYKDITYKEMRTCSLSDYCRQSYHENIEFIDNSCTEIINPNGEGSWSAITPCCVDIENSSALTKYNTFNNCRARLTAGRSGTTAFVIQGGECIQITNSLMSISDLGIWDALIKGNTFTRTSSDNRMRAVDVAHRDTFLYHRHVQWDDNTIDPKGEAQSIYMYIAELKEAKEQYYDDVRENAFPLRQATITKKAINAAALANIKLRNSRHGDEYID